MSRTTPPPTVPHPRRASFTDCFSCGTLVPVYSPAGPASNSGRDGQRSRGLHDRLEPLEPRADPRLDAAQRGRHQLALERAASGSPGVAGDEARCTGDGVGLIHEERVIVHLPVATEPVDRHDVPGTVSLAVLPQVREELGPLPVRDAL